MSKREKYSNIAILTGAGISRESGLETFRDKDGIWAKVSIDDVATPRAFARDPDRVHAFYNARRRKLLSPSIQPNAAHLALAKLEKLWLGKVILVTQNIDDLHERAGNTNIIHMHGQLLEAVCTKCHKVAPCREDLATTMACSVCSSKGTLRPNVVWFGEQVMAGDFIQEAAGKCDLFLSIGTSGTVYPAAALVNEAKSANAHTVELNLETSSSLSCFDEIIEGLATVVVPRYVEQLLDRRGIRPLLTEMPGSTTT
jgi:NAD-dependent protein deacetylase/lipoamidase